MKYGTNFGYPPIPAAEAAIVDHKIKVQGKTFTLEGAATSEQEAQQLVIQGTNGKRVLGWARFNNQPMWFVYACYIGG